MRISWFYHVFDRFLTVFSRFFDFSSCWLLLIIFIKNGVFLMIFASFFGFLHHFYIQKPPSVIFIILGIFEFLDTFLISALCRYFFIKSVTFLMIFCYFWAFFTNFIDFYLQNSTVRIIMFLELFIQPGGSACQFRIYFWNQSVKILILVVLLIFMFFSVLKHDFQIVNRYGEDFSFFEHF